MQAKLLRVVEEKQFEKVGGSKTIKVDVRIIAATNKNIEQVVKDNQFRRDLFFRLNIIPIKVPPLMERMEDISLLVEHFIEKFNYKMGKAIKAVAPEVLDIFMRYPWPGNVRELESVMEFAFIQCNDNYLDARFLPPRFKLLNGKVTDITLSTPLSYETFQFADIKPVTSSLTEKEKVLTALKDSRWNRARAADNLNISRTTLWRLMKKYNLK
jgi:Nif-specific regulatory protein